MSDEPAGKMVAEFPWTTTRARQWFTADQLSYTSYAWNHDKDDPVPATRIVVTENNRGHQDARAVCEECYPSVMRYVGGETA